MPKTKEGYYKLKAEGRCVNCRRPRGKDGTTTMCRHCADLNVKSQRKRRQRSDVYRQDLLNTMRTRAKQKGIPFDLSVEDIEWNTVCPVFGIPIYHRKKQANNATSLDRLIPEKGYVKGNVIVISTKANRMKQNATVKELRQIADWLEKQLDK